HYRRIRTAFQRLARAASSFRCLAHRRHGSALRPRLSFSARRPGQRHDLFDDDENLRRCRAVLTTTWLGTSVTRVANAKQGDAAEVGWVIGVSKTTLAACGKRGRSIPRWWSVASTMTVGQRRDRPRNGGRQPKFAFPFRESSKADGSRFSVKRKSADCRPSPRIG